MSLFSIQLNSNRPEQIVLLFDNIEQTADHPEEIEVLLHIDTGDTVMEVLTATEKTKRKFTLKVYHSDMVKGYATLWKPLNLLWQHTAPEAYFLLNISDEMLFETKGWDSIVKRYIGYYPDHVFRLRASKYRYRNYTDFWENGYAPDSIAFYTRKWLELSGDWNPCLGPDSFQQCVAFYLFTSEPFSHTQYNRDIPVPNLRFCGEGAGVGLEGLPKYKRIMINNRAWFVLMSHRMQQEASRRAMRIKSYILAEQYKRDTGEDATYAEAGGQFKVTSSPSQTVLHTLPYRLSWLRITLTNLWRMQEVHYYAGGGVRAKKYPFAGYFVMLCTYVPHGAEVFYQAARLRIAYGHVRPALKMMLSQCIHILKSILEYITPAVNSVLSLLYARMADILHRIYAASPPPLRFLWRTGFLLLRGMLNISKSLFARKPELWSDVPSAINVDVATGDNDHIYFSIQLSSNRPQNVLALLDNIERTATHPQRVEVLVHIDTGDAAMEEMLKAQQGVRKVSVRYLDTDLVKGFTHLWKAYNPLFQLTAPSAYFVTLFSDEMRFETHGWDEVLMAYEGHYPDHIFRVRCSKYRFRNYTDYWENGFAPDSLAFYTRKWLAIQGDWNPCTGPDSFQQSVAYYLFTADPFSHTQHHRDIPEPFLQFSGEGGGVGLEGEARTKRIRDNNHEWFSLMSHAMQQNARHRATLLKANILASRLLAAYPDASPVISESPQRRLIKIETDGKTPPIVLGYGISRMKVKLITALRAPWVHYYAGGGRECLKTHPWGGVNMMLDTFSPRGRRLIALLTSLGEKKGQTLRKLVDIRNHVRGSWRHHGFAKGCAILTKQALNRCIGRRVN